MKLRLASLAPLLLALVLVVGCDTSEPAPTRLNADATVEVFVLGEGPNTYLLRVSATEAYYPLNLPREFQEEGARLEVEGLVKGYDVLFHPALEIVAVRRRPS